MQSSFQLPAFQLKGTDGKEHGPSESTEHRATLVLFLCNHCPYVHRYAGRIKGLVEKYTEKGLAIYGINANDVTRYPEDSFAKMPEMGERLGLGNHYLHDASQEIAKAFKAERTPEAFLFNSAGELVYRGAIDDNNADPKAVTTHYLEDAIDAVLLNKVIQVDFEPPAGCTIKWKQYG